jgi:hypothetical protein
MQLVLSTGNGVNCFTLDPSLGEFILTHPDIKVLRPVLLLIPFCKLTKEKYNTQNRVIYA